MRDRRDAADRRGPGTHLYRILCVSIWAVFAIGCGTADTNVISIPEPYVTVITLDGEQQSVLASALYDPKTSQPAVRSVLVIDRQSNQQVFIDLDQLPAQSQMDARYILLTDQPGPSDSQAGTRH